MLNAQWQCARLIVLAQTRSSIFPPLLCFCWRWSRILTCPFRTFFMWFFSAVLDGCCLLSFSMGCPTFPLINSAFTFCSPLTIFLICFGRKSTMPSCSFASFLAHHPLPLSCRFEFISNQRATEKRPILIIPSFAYLHINDCRLCCFSAAVVPLPPTSLRLCLPTCCNTTSFSQGLTLTAWS